MRNRSQTPPTQAIDQATEMEHFLEQRHKKGRLAAAIFKFSVLLAIVSLATLLATVINKSMGYVVVINKVELSSLSSRPLEELTTPELIQILKDNLSKNRIRTLERNEYLADRSTSDLIQLIEAEIIEPEIVESYNLIPSVFDRDQIFRAAAANHPEGKVEFRFWVNRQFLTGSMSSDPGLAGIRPALLGSLALILITIVIAFPIGVGAAIYLEEYSSKESRLSIIQTNIDNLRGALLIYGLWVCFGCADIGTFDQRAVFGNAGGNGRTINAQDYQRSSSCL